MICCYCDNSLSCGACGMEQPDDSKDVRALLAAALDSPTVVAIAQAVSFRNQNLSKSLSEQLVDILAPNLMALHPAKAGEAAKGRVHHIVLNLASVNMTEDMAARQARRITDALEAAGLIAGGGENQPEKRTGPHRESGETNSGATGDSELTRSARPQVNLGTGSKSVPGLGQCTTPSPARELSDGSCALSSKP